MPTKKRPLFVALLDVIFVRQQVLLFEFVELRPALLQLDKSANLEVLGKFVLALLDMVANMDNHKMAPKHQLDL